MTKQIRSVRAAASLSILFAALASAAVGQEYRVETIDGPPESDDLAAAIVEQLQDSGVRVVKGERSVQCEIWLAKGVPLAEMTSDGVLFPLEPGGLVGAIRLVRRGYDFRDQPIDRGWYTLRYALQPVDGNHVGTSPTRDFLLASPAAEDVMPGDVVEAVLIERSQEAAQSTHPALISMQYPQDDAETPSLRFDEDHDWWLLHLVAPGEKDGDKQDLAFDLVVVGHASE